MTAAPSPRARRTRTRAVTTADAPARHLTEAQFRKQVFDLLKLGRWRYAYWPDSRHMQGHKGPPDIVAVRRGRLVFIETKRTGERPRAEQNEWRADILACPATEHYVWQPSDLAEIESVLR